MTYFSKILPFENVVLDLDVSSKKRAFEQAGLIFENNCSIARSLVSDNLFARERLGSTGLGHGVAVPHGRIKGLKAPIAAFIRLSEPIPFESPDGQPVNLLVFLLIPDNILKFCRKLLKCFPMMHFVLSLQPIKTRRQCIRALRAGSQVCKMSHK
jgi:nitrogen PTS system EIIA component